LILLVGEQRPQLAHSMEEPRGSTFISTPPCVGHL
jgi:hypothetical protein